jgi:hypothetical protein
MRVLGKRSHLGSGHIYLWLGGEPGGLRTIRTHAFRSITLHLFPSTRYSAVHSPGTLPLLAPSRGIRILLRIWKMSLSFSLAPFISFLALVCVSVQIACPVGPGYWVLLVALASEALLIYNGPVCGSPLGLAKPHIWRPHLVNWDQFLIISHSLLFPSIYSFLPKPLVSLTLVM